VERTRREADRYLSGVSKVGRRAFPRVEGGSRRVTQVSLNNMIAISHADYALWGIKEKWLDQPVLRLLGDGVQDRIPAYASTAGFSLSPENAAERGTMIC
jgi:L-alanine-DL-glutamate epimerase-like enolase superfamily enzyme